MIEHRENCLTINGKQSVRLKSGSISFKNYFKQLSFPFKIYADFEFFFKKVKSDFIECNSNSSYTTKYQDNIPYSFADKFVFIDNKFIKKLFFAEEKKCC